MPAADRLPKLRYHAGSGQFAVVLSGRWHYLGTESAAARRRYDVEVRRWLERGRTPEPHDDGGPLTVRGLVDAYRSHPDSRYAKDGRATSQSRIVAVSLRDLEATAGDRPAAGFGPDAISTLRLAWAGRGLSVATCGHYAQAVKLVFRWGVNRGLVPPDVWGRLQAATPSRGLARGRPRPRVGPVPPADLEATLAILQQPYRDLARLQALTGMRPGEAVLIRPCDLDRSGEVWSYRPHSHKTEHHDKERVVAVGPRAQAVLSHRLEATPDRSYVFASRNGRPKSLHRYRDAVARACVRAGVPHWHPSQLRHNAATEVRRRFGLDAAQVILGHSNADVTQVYAFANLEKAKEVAREIG